MAEQLGDGLLGVMREIKSSFDPNHLLNPGKVVPDGRFKFDTDLRLALSAGIRKVFAESPKDFDPRKYLGPARDELKKLYAHKNKEVLGSAGKA